MNIAIGSRKPLRLIVTGAIGVSLIGSAFSAALAGGGNVDEYDDDGGLSGGEVAGIVLGGGAAVWAATHFIGAGAAGGDCDDDDTAATPATDKKAASGTLKSRLVASDATPLSLGSGVTYRLQVRSGKGWKDVTADPATRMRADGGLVRVSGARNAFMLPLTATPTGPVTIRATYSPDRAPHAAAEVTLALARP